MKTRSPYLVARALVACGLATIAGCGKSTQFSAGNTAKPVLNKDLAQESNASPNNPETYHFQLKIPGDPQVLRNGIVDVVPDILHGDGGASLNADERADWGVRIGAGPAAADAASQDVVSQSFDLSDAGGPVVLNALFDRKDGKRNGKASANVFVDREPPQPTLLELARADGRLTFYWSATDNYAIAEAHSVLMACLAADEAFLPASAEELAKAPTGCEPILAGQALHAGGAKLEWATVTVQGQERPAASYQYLLYVEDLVGHGASAWMTRASEARATLLLASAAKGPIFTNKSVVTLPLTLQRVAGESVTAIDAAPALWGQYALDAALPQGKVSGAFGTPATFAIGTAEGLVSVVLAATETATGIASNKLTVNYVLDLTAPQIVGAKIEVLGGVLEPNAHVSVSWTPQDANGVVAHTLEIKRKGETTWTKIADLDGTKRQYDFTWGNFPASSFEIRIVAVDQAGNAGETSVRWVPQYFNAAVLTRSVECFFCHMRIEGDVAGINFPASVHPNAGENLKITGTIYATNAVPSQLASKAAASQPFYKNTNLKVFPKDTTGDGIPDFPALSANDMKPRMNGTVRLGNLFVSRVYEGNLVLAGTSAQDPIRIAGEVFVNGDLIIKGYYKGIGSIYAKNVYVVGDVVALDSPFPYPQDPAAAVAKAQDDIKAGKDGLYLGALNQLLVGATENALNDSGDKPIVSTRPYDWITPSAYLALGERAKYLRFANNGIYDPQSQMIPNPTTSDKVAVEVNRVDAYLYAQNVIVWRSYGNFLINGGFMGPMAGLVSSYPLWTYSRGDDPAKAPINPRNGLKATESAVRYDYRLRAGGAGFETLKSFFDQQ